MGGAVQCRKGKIGLTDVGSVSRWSQPTISRFAGRAIERLVTGLAPLADHDFRAPSLLPRFTRGHVVTHLANKARAHAWLFGGPAEGEVQRLHPAGYDADGAAYLGAGRSATELRTDLKGSFDLLEAAWIALDARSWNELGGITAGPRNMVEIIVHHLRNVEVHHVDLDVGYLASHWPTQFVEGGSPSASTRFPDVLFTQIFSLGSSRPAWRRT